MTPVSELVENLRARGFSLRIAEDGTLMLRGPVASLPPEELAALRVAKPLLLELLRAGPPSCAPAGPPAHMHAHPPAAPHARASSPTTAPEALAWRMSVMRQQVRPGEPLPVLMAIPGRTPEAWDEAGCLSCGEPLAGGTYRCGPCIEAARRVVAECMARRGKKGRG